MANVTDPLARHIHGTNPQNLLEYITRQKIYDSRYWKEECFGLAAGDIAEKAATQLRAIGGSYGGNSQPTRFLCLVLKMLQIQPDDDVVEELVANEEFKYVRALGAFYLRLTGRPADIYAQLEPLLNDYRPLRRRDVTEWTLTAMESLGLPILIPWILPCHPCSVRDPRAFFCDQGNLIGRPMKPMITRVGHSVTSMPMVTSTLFFQPASMGHVGFRCSRIRRGPSQLIQHGSLLRVLS